MVRKLAIVFLYNLLFLYALIYFLPKENLYFLVQDKMQELHVDIESSKRVDHPLSFEIIDSTIYFKAIKSAEIESVDLDIFIFLTKVELRGISLAGLASSFVPTKIDSIEISHSILSPTEIKVDATGEFGEARGELNLLSRVLKVKLKSSKIMLSKYRKLLKHLKKDEDGEYIYEKKL